jgi:hypothetical protein
MTFVFLLLAAADLPAVIDYEAPAECAPADVFKAEVQAQLTQAPRQARRFLVRIHRGNDFAGTLTTTSGAREIHAQSCAEVTSALAVIVAMAIPEMPVATESAAPPSTQPAAIVAEPSRPGLTWRLGARLQGFNQLFGSQEYYSSPSQIIGGALVGSVEPQWGRYRMLFELTVGLSLATFPGQPRTYHCPSEGCGPVPAVVASRATFLSLDAQVCPLDVALGHFGLAALACTRLGIVQQWVTEDFPYSESLNGTPVGGLTSMSNLAVQAGANVRLRWQSPWYVYAEAQVGLVVTSQSPPLSGSPLALDWGATLGTRL